MFGSPDSMFPKSSAGRTAAAGASCSSALPPCSPGRRATSSRNNHGASTKHPPAAPPGGPTRSFSGMMRDEDHGSAARSFSGAALVYSRGEPPLPLCIYKENHTLPLYILQATHFTSHL